MLKEDKSKCSQIPNRKDMVEVFGNQNFNTVIYKSQSKRNLKQKYIALEIHKQLVVIMKPKNQTQIKPDKAAEENQTPRPYAHMHQKSQSNTRRSMSNIDKSAEWRIRLCASVHLGTSCPHQQHVIAVNIYSQTHHFSSTVECNCNCFADFQGQLESLFCFFFSAETFYKHLVITIVTNNKNQFVTQFPWHIKKKTETQEEDWNPKL